MEQKRLIERRKYIRLPFETEVKYTIEGYKGGQMEAARSCNISPEGLCLIFKKTVEKGMLLRIEITIQELPPCSLTGEVIWTKTLDDKKQSGQKEIIAGIKIVDIDKNDKSRFMLELCDKMVNELGQKYPNIQF